MDNSDDKPNKPKNAGRGRRRRLTPEEIWVRGFLGTSGTQNVTRAYLDGLVDVSLTRAVEGLCCGTCVSVEKCDGPGCVCVFEHESDDDAVEVTVFFVAAEEVLEVRGARILMEAKSEPDAA